LLATGWHGVDARLRLVALDIAPAITTPPIPLGGNAIASEELAGRALSVGCVLLPWREKMT
jgi:hypothetical protein